MNFFLKSGSYIFHPIWLSTYAMLFYFSYLNFMFSYENVLIKILQIVVITIFIPLVFLKVIKSLRIINDYHLREVSERRLPLLFFTTLSAIILNYVFDPIYYKIPFYFFSAIFLSGLITVILAFVNYKISLHAIGISSFATFIVGFSLLYQTSSLWAVSFSVFAVGWVLSSRLLLKAHKVHELISGLILGIGSQILCLQFWFL